MKRYISILLLIILCMTVWLCQTTDHNNIKSETVPYKATQEEYDQTFAEVNYFIKKIQSTILKKDYETWKSICTDVYIEKYSSKSVLQELSETPQLKARNVKLSSLKDFFIIVFIPSRRNQTSDKIEFVTKTRVKAFTVTGDNAYVLYLLEKDKNNEWKIGLW